MTGTIKEVLKFIEQNDVKFIKLAFCDLFGTQKNISIMPEELERAFCDGISFDGSNILGFSSVENSDLLLVPDPSTLSVLPWRPQQGRVVRFYCHILNVDKTPFEYDTRNLLCSVIRRCEQMGYLAQIGTECEFYLFNTDEHGNGTHSPFDRGTYLDTAPLDRGENIRREICLCLEDMGIRPETSHHESGPGQNEIDFRYNDALEAADNFITFKAVVKAIAARNGLYASFMPKPLLDFSGSGLHLNLSLAQNGHNIFESDGKFSTIAESFIAGVLHRVAEITAILNPLVNSYERFGHFEAPKYISWSYYNRSQLIRIPSAVGEKTRMELRSTDCATNPYLAFALILSAGLDGIENGMQLDAPITQNLYSADKSVVEYLELLPTTLEIALNNLSHSEFAKNTLGGHVIDKFVHIKRQEYLEFKSYKSALDFYNDKYFERV